MSDSEALGEVIGQVQFLLADAEDVAQQMAGTKRVEALRIARGDVEAYRAQLRALERARALIEAEDGAERPLAAE